MAVVAQRAFPCCSLRATAIVWRKRPAEPSRWRLPVFVLPAVIALVQVQGTRVLAVPG